MQVCRLGRTELNELNSFLKRDYFFHFYKSLNNHRQINSFKILDKNCHSSSKWIDEMFESLLFAFCKLGTLL